MKGRLYMYHRTKTAKMKNKGHLVTLSLKRTGFEMFDFKYTVILKIGLGSFKVIENVTIR